MPLPRATTIAAAALVIAGAFLSGCHPLSPRASDPCQLARYGGKKMEPYIDTAEKFRLCVPKGLQRSGPAGFADERIVFSGFAVPAGTNLQAKMLIIVAGAYGELPDPTPFGHFSAGGVNFTRVKATEGAAGHSVLHIIYTWTKHNGKTVHFDFVLLAVNPQNFDPGNRPAVYDQTAQIKLTEAIMSTFTPLH